MSLPSWAELHGAVTHFPIALTLGAGVCDTAGFLLNEKPASRGLLSAGYWMQIGAALASFPAVVSGLLMTRGAIWGHGALRMHHLFIWPAFALIVGLATWRVLADLRLADRGSRWGQRRVFGCYLAALACAVVSMIGAGYWGGMMMNGV